MKNFILPLLLATLSFPAVHAAVPKIPTGQTTLKNGRLAWLISKDTTGLDCEAHFRWMDSLKNMPLDQQIRAVRERAILESKYPGICRPLWIVGGNMVTPDAKHPQQLAFFLKVLNEVRIGQIETIAHLTSDSSGVSDAGAIVIIPKYKKGARQITRLARRMQ